MNRQEYNACMRPYITGSKPKEQRKLDFCEGAKRCSGKASTKEEAIRLCSLPKEPKPPRSPRRSPRNKVNCEQNMEEVTQCLVGKITPTTTADEIYQTLVKCHCKKNPKRVYASDINKLENPTLAAVAQLQNEHESN